MLSQQKDKETEDEKADDTAEAQKLVIFLWIPFNWATEIEIKTWLKIGELKNKLRELNTELERERKDKEAMKSQSESLHKEYDRLTEEYSKLERKLTVGDSRKSD